MRSTRRLFPLLAAVLGMLCLLLALVCVLGVGLLSAASSIAVADTLTPQEQEGLAETCVDNVIVFGGDDGLGWTFSGYTVNPRGQHTVVAGVTVRPMTTGLPEPNFQGGQDGYVPCPAPAGQTTKARLVIATDRIARGHPAYAPLVYAPASPWVTIVKDSPNGVPAGNPGRELVPETFHVFPNRVYTCLPHTLKVKLAKLLHERVRDIARDETLQVSTSAHSLDKTKHRTLIAYGDGFTTRC